MTVPYRMLVAYAKTGNNTNRHNTQTNTLRIDEARMHNAKCYDATNCMQRKDALDIITEYQGIFQWSPKGDDILLDIGTGSGDVTHDCILQIMPQKSQIVASDKSQEMIDYASVHFSLP
ncbi:hypothetical protein HA402_008795 [Bradysia odoriphaga]|nr:hypothetical protein HA402_008795 [Bradysia odoriphaga]